MGSVTPERHNILALRLARDTGARIRLYDSQGKLVTDTRALGLRNFVLRDPDKENWQQDTARFLDAVIDTVVGAPRAPLYRERAEGLEWPDVHTARSTESAPATVWRAPDRTPVITAARARCRPAGVVMTTVNARDITQTVRVERFRLERGAGDRLGHLDPALAVPRADDRAAAARASPAPRCACGWGARAKWWCPACPRAATSWACSRALCRT